MICFSCFLFVCVCVGGRESINRRYIVLCELGLFVVLSHLFFFSFLFY